MVIFVTGDMHGRISITRLGSKNFPEGKNLTKDDYVIIAGDFGFVWLNKTSKEEKNWLDWLKNKPFTTLIVDGNHENHDKLDTMPVSIWKGGKVHFINDSVIHLMRGQIFNIDNKKIFTFGGASSIDIECRTEGKDWWRRELPSIVEYNEGIKNLEKVNSKVDYIITHTCPIQHLLRLVDTPMPDPLMHYLGDIHRN